MTKVEKTLDNMRNNPRDWQIADLKCIAGRYGITIRNGKGSHISFTHPKWIEIVTVPAHRPIKPVYVKKFIAAIDSLNEGEI